MRYLIQIFTGILFISTVGIAYLPSALENGMCEFELTFLSNLVMGCVFLTAGVKGLLKKKNLSQTIYINSVILLQIVFLICMAFIKEFNFSGAFMFLHVVNPILATVEVFLFNECKEMPKPGTVFSALVFPILYLTYAIVYGYISGHWIYGIINIPERGIIFVLSVLSVTGVGIVVLVWLQYKINCRYKCK